MTNDDTAHLAAMPDAERRALAAKYAAAARQELIGRLTTSSWASIEAQLLEMPRSYRYEYLRAMLGKSPMAAIHTHCRECVGWVRDEVTRCTSPACPLYPYRPYQAEGSTP